MRQMVEIKVAPFLSDLRTTHGRGVDRPFVTLEDTPLLARLLKVALL